MILNSLKISLNRVVMQAVRMISAETVVDEVWNAVH